MTQRLPFALGLLAAIAVAGEFGRRLDRVWYELRRPAAVSQRGFGDGLAISLAGLERERLAMLPGLELRGAVLDRRRRDWILLAERDPARQPWPADALVVALRALRTETDLPGVDIRSARAYEPEQHVTYFGGVQGTIVGSWFLRFDHWMKRASLGAEPVPISGFPVYAERARAALDDEAGRCKATAPETRFTTNRYWLCGTGLTGIEDASTLVLDGRSLRVLAETTGGAPTDRHFTASATNTRPIRSRRSSPMR